MNEAQEVLMGLEWQKKAAEAQIEFSKRVEKLLQNPEFQAVIMREYMVEEASRFILQSCDPAFNPQQRADALAMAQAAGHLKRWLQATQTQAKQIIERMPELEAEIENARAEADAEPETGDDEE